MITRAYLVADRDVRVDQIIAGLPVLLRQTLALQAAGIAEIAMVGVSPQSVRRDPRVHINVHEAADLPAHPEEPALVAVAGAVWTPAFVQALARAPVSALAPMVPVRSGEFVVVPRTARDVEAATALLMRALYKPTDGIISRYLNRRLSLPISRRLLRFNVTPNHLTALATVFGLAGVGVAYRGGYWSLLVGTLLLQMQSLLDGCDGEIARIKYLHSRAGEWFDQVADDVLNIACLAAVGAALARGGYRYASWIAGVSVACQVVYMIALYAGLAFKAGGRGSVATLRWWVDKPGPSSAPTRIVGDLTRRDFICFAYFACAALNCVVAAFVWHAIVTVLSCVVTTVGWIVFGGPEYRANTAFNAESAENAAS